MSVRACIKGVVATVSFAVSAVVAQSEMSSAPNFVFIQVDDLGWSDLGCYGNSFHRTPRIDRLAREGMRFTSAYAAAPICLPTRASVLTGQYPARLHTTGQPGYKQDDQSERICWHPNFRTHLPEGTRTLAHELRRVGYESVCIGKFGVEGEPKSFGLTLKEGDNDQLTEYALEYLREKHNDPFFLYLNYHWVHIPLESDPERVARFVARLKPGMLQNPTYAAMIEEVDEAVGRILDEMERLELAENTVVIFTSDNGGFLGHDSDRFVTTNAPLREGKASLYEGGIRVPLIVRWSGKVPENSLSEVPVISVDFFPTFLELVGVEPPSNQKLDGLSLVPVLLQRHSLHRETLYWHWPHYRRAMPGIHASASSAIRHGRWKLIEFFEDRHVELYDLGSDLGETNDLAQRRPNKVLQLHTMLMGWREKVGAQLPARNPRFAEPWNFAEEDVPNN